MNSAGKMKHPLGDGGFASVDMRDEADISHV
jgi:hypothetical protein